MYPDGVNHEFKKSLHTVPVPSADFLTEAYWDGRGFQSSGHFMLGFLADRGQHRSWCGYSTD